MQLLAWTQKFFIHENLKISQNTRNRVAAEHSALREKDFKNKDILRFLMLFQLSPLLPEVKSPVISALRVSRI